MSITLSERLANKVRIRLLEPEDSLAHLTGMLHRAYKQHMERGIQALAAFQPEEVTRRRVSDGECFVALYMGRIVGTIMFKTPEQTARAWPSVPWFDRPEGGVASFSQFAVEPEHQGKGIGMELLKRAEERAAAVNAAELALSTPGPAEWLVAMYQRHGYREVARWHWNETNYDSLIMSKKVDGVSDQIGR